MFSLHKTKGGVHPPQHKDTRDCPVQYIDPPKKVRIPLNMHIGKPCEPCVSVGDHVYVGTLIGDGEGLYAPVHASISGTVTSVAVEDLPTGQRAPVVEIEGDGKMDKDPSIKKPTYSTKEEFIDCVRASGVVGLGGASFPTWFKMKAPAGKKFEYLLVNGMECEPFITSDFRQMMEHAGRVIDGCKRIIDALEIPACCIGIEDNKPEAIELLTKTVEEKGVGDKIEVMAVPTKYPAGGEKVLIMELTGRAVPAGGLPVDAGCLVMNVTSVSRVEEYFRYGEPLVRKTITVDGDCVKNPGNYRVPVGMNVRDVIEVAGGLVKEPRKVLMGGPMMGRAISSLDCPVLKANNAILCWDDLAVLPEQTPCIKCGRCVRACPLGLDPARLAVASNNHDLLALDELGVMNCMDCGSCTYTCPAHRHINDAIRNGKAFYRAEIQRLAELEKGGE